MFALPSDELIRSAGKLQAMDGLLKKLKAGDHRVLIFTQVRVRLVFGSLSYPFTTSDMMILTLKQIEQSNS